MTELCELADRVCEPCRGGIPPMDDETAQNFLKQLPDVHPPLRML